MRTIILTGSGGVGKSTLSAATAVGCAARGHKTAHFSTDSIPTLHHVYKQEIGLRPRKLAENLDVWQVSNEEVLERQWPYAWEYIKRLQKRGIVLSDLIDPIGADSLSGAVELGAVEGYDVAVFDLGAGPRDAVKALLYPRNLATNMEGFDGLFHGIVRFLRHQPFKWFIERRWKTPLPEEALFDDLRGAAERSKRSDEILRSGDATLRLVAGHDPGSLEAAAAGTKRLKAAGFKADALLLNMAEGEAEEMPGELAKLPRFFAGEWKKRPAGMADLKKLAEELYGGKDPAERFGKEKGK
jgi:arsenite-transporting ATPase